MYLQNLSSVKLREKTKIRAILFDNPKIHSSLHETLFLDTLNNSSLIFLYVTRNFCENKNGWKHFSKQTWINEFINNEKCVVINFHGGRLPMGLNSLPVLNGAEKFGSHLHRIQKILEDHVERRIKIEKQCKDDIYEWISINLLKNPISNDQAAKKVRIFDINVNSTLPNEEEIEQRKEEERKVQVVKPQVRPVARTRDLPGYSSGEYVSLDSSVEIDGSGEARTNEFTADESRAKKIIIHHHYHQQDTIINIYQDEREMVEIESRNRTKTSGRDRVR